MARNITPREQDYSQWYLDIIKAAELADYAPVRGCMVVRPTGYAIWEDLQAKFDKAFKETGHVNAYFPLLIPSSFLRKEAEHVEGFAPECAVVTHAGGEELEEPLVIRPTSETVIGAMYSKWVQSWRDLPLLINQWANVLRWEKRPRLFLRTSEFLWQEGHTAHATAAEAEEETVKMLNVYAKIMKEDMALPVVEGVKSEGERFPGALDTYTCETMVSDTKALQAGTSHFLGQNFAKAFNIQFQDQNGAMQYAWTTSWGVSTRMIGAIIMVHGDDNGLVLPPKVAPIQLAIIPIAQHKPGVLDKANALYESLKTKFRVKLDDTDNSPGWKFSQYEMQGVPLRLEIGPKDIEQNQCVLVRRDTREKIFVSLDNLEGEIEKALQAVHDGLYERALKNLEEKTFTATTYEEFLDIAENKPGFIKAMWCGDSACEDKLKDATGGVKSRCIPFKEEHLSDVCVCCGKPAKHMVYWGRQY